ncbi:MAG: spore maturation protein, partial [Ferruginibacter sp.]|nr:spore maturation protein [Ferruginibacter sp.]
MALSRIWSAFIIVAITVAGIKCFFFGDSQIFSWMVSGKASDPLNPLKVDGVIETCWVAVDICLKLVGILALFIGFMNIAEKAGGIRLLSRIVGPFFSKLFPEIPQGHPSMGHMIMNFSANLLGLDNAATPFGLKAMESLQELNTNKDMASNSQIMFLCLHAAGLNLIPVSVIAVRAAQHASDPTDVFLPCMIVTFVGTMTAMIIVSFKQKI